MGSGEDVVGVLGCCVRVVSSRSRDRNWECVKHDVNQHSGVFCLASSF